MPSLIQPSLPSHGKKKTKTKKQKQDNNNNNKKKTNKTKKNKKKTEARVESSVFERRFRVGVYSIYGQRNSQTEVPRVCIPMKEWLVCRHSFSRLIAIRQSDDFSYSVEYQKLVMIIIVYLYL